MIPLMANIFQNLKSNIASKRIYYKKILYYFCSMFQLDQKLRKEFQQIGKPAKYGTAGFRDLAANMSYISFRVGVFVAILNKTQPSKSLGVVMSASHNKIEDNGVKITNFNGNMLERYFEPVLENFVEQLDLSKAIEGFKQYLIGEGKVIFQCPINVFIGGDTRPSTNQLLDLVAKGVEHEKGRIVNFKLTTTPQLQYYVYLYNTVIKPKNIQKETIDPQQLRQLYWKNFSDYYKKCINYLGQKTLKNRCLDPANGVGGKIFPYFQSQLKDYFSIDYINNTNAQLLNKKCGADFIKVEKTFPSEYSPKEYNCFVAFDGDADRIVFFTEHNKQLQLIDGDREGTIFTTFYKRITEELKQRTDKLNQSSSFYMNAPTNPNIGFVQTFYANYSSSEYLLQNFQMQPVYAATGVKYLHEKAEHFDIGVYFQANGHGTVIFKESFLGKIQALLQNRDFLLNSQFIKNNQNLTKEVKEYFDFVEFYFYSCKLANPSVGDAICNFLIFQLALSYLKIGYDDTLKLYTDLKSKTSKIAVKSKQNVRTTDIEDKVVSPAGLQQQIDEIIKKHDGRKAFLRPSGTQNVLRLHVEAKTESQVEQISKQIHALVSVHPELN